MSSTASGSFRAGVLGAVRPYKRIEHIIDVWPEGPELLIRGRSDAAYEQLLRERIAARGPSARIQLVTGFMSREEFEREMNQLERVILGTDAPAGSGVQPLGILRMVSMLSSLGDVPAEIAFCFATGNTTRMRKLDTGLIEKGMAADFVFLDKAQHSAGKDLLESVRLGDLPGQLGQAEARRHSGRLAHRHHQARRARPAVHAVHQRRRALTSPLPSDPQGRALKDGPAPGTPRGPRAA